MTPRHTALYDANVLYPSLLRNLLMRLAVSGMVAARWTDAIHDEWGWNLLLNRPDAQVTGYEPLIETLSLPDPDDRHVLAAAIHAQADVIVTLNLKDFPQEHLELCCGKLLALER